MKIMHRFHIWDLKRDIKNYEAKVRLLKQAVKYFEKQYKEEELSHA